MERREAASSECHTLRRSKKIFIFESPSLTLFKFPSDLCLDIVLGDEGNCYLKVYTCRLYNRVPAADYPRGQRYVICAYRAW